MLFQWRREIFKKLQQVVYNIFFLAQNLFSFRPAANMFSVFKTEQDVLKKLQDLIEFIANESINNRGKFFIGFSGNVENCTRVTLNLINIHF